MIDLSGLGLIIAVEGDIAAVDTETAIATYGSAGAQTFNSVKAHIKKILVCCATDHAAVGESAVWVRIRGKGVKNPIDIPVCALSSGTVAQGTGLLQSPVEVNVDIPIDGEVIVRAEMSGADTGTINLGAWMYG